MRPTALSLIVFLFCLFYSCNSDTDQAADAKTDPVSATTTTTKEQSADAFPQDAAIQSIAFSQQGEVMLCTYQAAGDDLQNTMVSKDGLNSYENHIANMLALTSIKCQTYDQTVEMVSFVFLDKNRRLLGRFDMPCNFSRAVYRSIGVGSTRNFSTQVNGTAETLKTNQLQIEPDNLAKYQNIVRGLQAQDHNGVKIGSIFPK